MNPKERSRNITIISVIVLFLLIYFGLKPILAKLKSANTEVKVKKEELSLKEKKLDNLKTIKSKLETVKGDLELLQKALPKEEDIPGVLVSAEALASQSGLLISSFTPSTEKKATATPPAGEEGATGLGSVPFNLSLSGSYPALLTFLTNVENNLRPTSVSSVNITGGGTDKPLSINLKMVSYYQK